MKDKRYPTLGNFLFWKNQSWLVFNIELVTSHWIPRCVKNVQIINEHGEIRSINYYSLEINFLSLEDREEAGSDRQAQFDGKPFSLKVFLTHEDTLLRDLSKLLLNQNNGLNT